MPRRRSTRTRHRISGERIVTRARRRTRASSRSGGVRPVVISRSTPIGPTSAMTTASSSRHRDQLTAAWLSCGTSTAGCAAAGGITAAVRVTARNGWPRAGDPRGACGAVVGEPAVNGGLIGLITGRLLVIGRCARSWMCTGPPRCARPPRPGRYRTNIADRTRMVNEWWSVSTALGGARRTASAAKAHHRPLNELARFLALARGVGTHIPWLQPGVDDTGDRTEAGAGCGWPSRIGDPRRRYRAPNRDPRRPLWRAGTTVEPGWVCRERCDGPADTQPQVGRIGTPGRTATDSRPIGSRSSAARWRAEPACGGRAVVSAGKPGSRRRRIARFRCSAARRCLRGCWCRVR